MGTATNHKLKLTRLREKPRGIPTWAAAGRPFRLVALGSGWLVVPVGGDARRLLVRHDLLARPLPTRAAALQALSTVLAGTAANREAGRCR
jgi:hypothetical protein